MNTLQAVSLGIVCWFAGAVLLTFLWAVTLNAAKAKRNVGPHRASADNCVHYSGDKGFVDCGSCPLCRPKSYNHKPEMRNL